MSSRHGNECWEKSMLTPSGRRRTCQKILCDRGKATTVVKLLEDLVPVVERTLGEKHVGMNMTKANLARANIKCDRWADAEPLIHESYAQTAEDHPNWIDVATGLDRVQHSR